MVGRSSRRTRLADAHKGNLRLWRINKSLLLLGHFRYNSWKMKIKPGLQNPVSKKLRSERQAKWVKQKTRDTTQYKIVIIYIFKKKKLTFGSLPFGRGANQKWQDWLLCRWQVRYKQPGNLGWNFFHVAIIIKFLFLFFLFYVFSGFISSSSFFFLEKGRGKGRKNKIREKCPPQKKHSEP